MKIDTEQTSPEIRAALIVAVSRVYAAGLESANSTSEKIRRDCAAGDVAHFLETLENHSEIFPASYG